MPLPTETVQTYIQILNEELLAAMGCTEPIAIAYAASILRATLGCEPTRIEAGFSGNIIKNVKSVIVPATGGMHGIEAAVAAGAPAAIAATSENPKAFGKSIIFVALGESIALYGVVISILILNKI